MKSELLARVKEQSEFNKPFLDLLEDVIGWAPHSVQDEVKRVIVPLKLTGAILEETIPSSSESEIESSLAVMKSVPSTCIGSVASALDAIREEGICPRKEFNQLFSKFSSLSDLCFSVRRE